MQIKGFDQLSKQLDQIAKNAKELQETKSASVNDIFTPSFISQHTRFANASDFFDASGFNMSTQADFEAIPEDRMDLFIRSESSFSSWREMVNAAGVQWAKHKLGL